MSKLPKSLPRALERTAFNADPFSFLGAARELHGDIFAVVEGDPLFSRNADCPGVIAVFGEQNLAQVLDENRGFAMPMSAARTLDLPEELVNLNRGLHSMTGEEHGPQKTALATHASSLSTDDMAQVQQLVQRVTKNWTIGEPIKIVSHLRALMIEIAGELFFGKGDEARQIALDMSSYFQMRRKASSQFGIDVSSRDQLASEGQKVDRQLRAAILDARSGASDDRPSLLQRLSVQKTGDKPQYSEDQIVGHLNVLFISATEPVTMSLTWSLLTLSQKPEILERLRALASATERKQFMQEMRPVLMEVLRLLTPNAFMTRVAARDVKIGDFDIAANTEILICPLLVHREEAVFVDPNRFNPERWGEIKPARYQYFPFGAGTHVCLGRSFAFSLLETILLEILSAKNQLILEGGQSIDWQISIMLCPDRDILFTPSGNDRNHPVLSGAVKELIG